MLPSPRLLDYGNTIEKWYTGSEVLAYDSKLFSTGSFTDYTGKTVSVLSNPYGSSGVSPSLGTEIYQYGQGINLNTGSLGNIGLSPSFLSGSWCVDFWVKYRIVGTSSTDALPFYPLMNDNNTGTGNYLEFQCHSSLKYLSVFQGGSWIKTGTDYLNELRSGTFNHFCMQYNFNSKTLYVYVNGVLKMTYTSLNYTVPNTSYNGFLWGNYINRSFSSAVVERVRIRTGIYFAPTGFTPSDSFLYPGTPM